MCWRPLALPGHAATLHAGYHLRIPLYLICILVSLYLVEGGRDLLNFVAERGVAGVLQRGVVRALLLDCS